MPGKRPSPELLQIWRFVRGDTAPRDFERWVDYSPLLYEQLGEELYQDLFTTDYAHWEDVCDLKRRLAAWAQGREPLRCECITLPDLNLVDMGEHYEVFETLDEVVRRGEPFWWLSAYRCRECDDWWLVAQEERHNDVFCLRRLSESEVGSILAGREWPQDFDRYETLLKLGMEMGRHVDFVDPVSARSLRWTIEDLARARPGIKLSELAALLNLDLKTASALARGVAGSTGVIIKFEKG
jgi:hypothetical protein